jgi:hypothetical protein
MTITQRRIIHDHGTEQRKQAIRALAGKIDAQDNPRTNWLFVALVVALLLGLAYATGVHLTIAEIIK